jgi:hypothetical protein
MDEVSHRLMYAAPQQGMPQVGEKAMLSNVATVFQDYLTLILAANQLALERTDDDAIKLVSLRRELAQKTTDMHRVLDAFLASHNISETDTPYLREHRAMFSAEHGAVSQHQAKWTAVDMRANRDRYEDDVKALFNMHKDNHDWRMRVLIPALKKLTET